MLAAFKLRAVPINVNYRYVERELRYLFDDADLVALVVPRGVRRPWSRRSPPSCPTSATSSSSTTAADADGAARGAVDYEEALAAASPERASPAAAPTTSTSLYTGGTTGMPKGVMWRHEDLFFAALGGGDPTARQGPDHRPRRARRPHPRLPRWRQLVRAAAHARERPAGARSSRFFGGGTVGAPPPGRSTRAEVLAAGRSRSGSTSSPSSATPWPGRCSTPLAADPTRRTTRRSLFAFASGGAILSPAVKARARASCCPHVIVIDTFGSSETGVAGIAALGGRRPGSRRFTVDDRTAVLDDDLRPVEPGSGVDRPARPAGATCRSATTRTRRRPRPPSSTVDGVRWVLPGDIATVDDDGTVVLLAGVGLASTPAARRSSPRRSRPCSRATPTCSTCWWSACPTTAGASGSPPSSQPGPGQRAHARRPRRRTPGPSSPATRCRATSSLVDEVRRAPERQARLRLGQGARPAAELTSSWRCRRRRGSTAPVR